MEHETPNYRFSFVMEISIMRGKNLVAKDQHWLTRKKTTSDPYVCAYYGQKFLGKTETKSKTLNPTWNWKVRIAVPLDDAIRARQGYTDMAKIRLMIFDKDKLTDDDFMGEITVPVCLNDTISEEWYQVGTGDKSGNLFCHNASGDVKVKVEISQKRGITMRRGSIYEIPTKKFDLTLQWNDGAGQITNLDNSCVAVDNEGNILMDQSVYLEQSTNSNGSVCRSNMVENCGTIFSCNLQSLPIWVRALYFILIVETPNKTCKDLKHISAKISDGVATESFYQYEPVISGEHTAKLVMRIVRENHRWTTTLVEDIHDTEYSHDILSEIQFNPASTTDETNNLRMSMSRLGGEVATLASI